MYVVYNIKLRYIYRTFSQHQQLKNSDYSTGDGLGAHIAAYQYGLLGSLEACRFPICYSVGNLKYIR